MSFSSYFKDPQAEEDVLINWRPQLGTDTIVPEGSTWPVLPPGIDVVETTTGSDNQTTRLKVKNGTHMRSYRFVNRIRTTGGRTHEWVVLIYVEETTIFAAAPPWVTMRDATAYVPGALGAAPVKLQTDLNRAAQWVADWAPRPYPAQAIMLGDLSETQDYLPVVRVQDWPYEGVLRCNDELIRWFGKETLSGRDTGPGNLTGLQRGQYATPATEHEAGAIVTDYEYNIRAQAAVKALFEWLWQTRGFRPSRSGPVGSESYASDIATAKALVKQDMGHFFTGGGRIKTALIGSPVPRQEDLGVYNPWKP